MKPFVLLFILFVALLGGCSSETQKKANALGVSIGHDMKKTELNAQKLGKNLKKGTEKLGREMDRGAKKGVKSLQKIGDTLRRSLDGH